MEAIFLIGIQGSGKTTFYRESFFDSHLRLNLDMLKTRHRLNVLMDACFASKQRFVVDNTNVRREERAEYIKRAQAAGFTVVGYYFIPNVDRALRWNAQREGRAKIPVKGVLGTLMKLNAPAWSEGFARLYQVEIDGNGRFVTQPILEPEDRSHR